ncbi:MAG: prephenate dehydrogenase/arogenate dehydrogenase family protein [Anaerolineae bacterium]
MAKAKIAIIGLGFVGSSIGLALCQSEGERAYEVIGHDKDPQVASAARKAGAVDRTEWNLINTVEGADLVILALPLSAIQETMQLIADALKPGCIVTDTATVKEPVLRWSRELLPETVHFVGGDPIISAPPDALGVAAASADVLKGAVYCLCPAATAAPDAVQVVTDMVQRMGAEPLFLDSTEHDGMMAGVEQLPSIMAAALLEITAQTAPWREMRRLAGTSYQQATHFGSEDAATYSDAAMANRDNVVRWIDTLIDSLERWKERIVAGEDANLGEAFQEALKARQEWMRGKRTGQWEQREPIDYGMGSYWRGLFGLGGRGKKR